MLLCGPAACVALPQPNDLTKRKVAGDYAVAMRYAGFKGRVVFINDPGPAVRAIIK